MDSSEQLPSDEILRQEIEQKSPEGRPAVPRLGPMRITIWLISLGVFALGLGVLVAILTNLAGGVLIAVLGLLLIAVNPEVWAAAARARERRDIRRDLAEPDTRKESSGSGKEAGA